MDKYTICTDVYAGSDTVKSKGTEYLPYTPGMASEILSKDPSEIACGKLRYEYYLDRAIFYNYFAATIDTAVGIIATDGFDELSVPDSVIDINSLNLDNENIYQINANINLEQCITGRTGLLVDPRTKGINLIQYYANSIIDYRSKIVNGVKYLTDILLLEENETYLYAFIDNGIYKTTKIDDAVDIDDAKQNIGEVTIPLLNGKAYDRIPFVFINAYNLKMKPQNPPYYDLARLCLDIYKNSADYQQYLFESSQNTLTLTGFNKKDYPDGLRVGSGSVIFTNNTDAKAYYVGVDSSGLSVMHDTLKELKETAKSTSVDIVSTAKGESGVALEAKIYVKSNSIRLIASTGAAGIENALKLAAEWYGNDSVISVKGNSKFTSASISIDNLIKLLDKQAIDLNQVHSYLYKIGVVSNEKM